MTEQVCGRCCHWREQPRPVDPRTGAVALGADAPRQGNCFKGPPQFAHGMGPQGMMIQSIYPPLPEAFPACDQFAARQPLNGTAEPEQLTAWWDGALRTILEASARGESFLVECLMSDLDQRLRQAEQPERLCLLQSLLDMYATLDRLHEQGATDAKEPQET